MATMELIEGYQGRRALYRLDDRAMSIMKETWPLISPALASTSANPICDLLYYAFAGLLVAFRAALIPHVQGDLSSLRTRRSHRAARCNEG
jgi:hypothetical protein